MRDREQPLIIGRLVAHGRARYQFRAHEDVSYFLKLLTQRGERTLWGKDLERAIGASSTQAQIGDMVGARRIGREAVTVIARKLDAEGRTRTETAQLAHRNRWVVEKVTFFAERARLARRVRDARSDASTIVKERPELASTYLTLRGAERIAERRIADPQDRARFVALVREAIGVSVKNGEPLPTVRLRERAKRTHDTPVKRKDEPTR